MNVRAAEIDLLIRTTFGGARNVDIMDAEYELLAPDQTAKLTKQFYRQLTALGLGMWTKNKRDCDKAARLCVAYVIVRQALSRSKNAKAIGTISYLVNGEKGRGHMVNVGVERHGRGLKLVTSEPEGGRGPFTMSQKERQSVWRVSV